MSTLQVSNLHFESTGNNRIQYTGANAFNLVGGGTTVATVNTTAVNFPLELSTNNIIANTISVKTITANGSTGSAGQVLFSSGASANASWGDFGGVDVQLFNSSGTWSKPVGYSANSRVHMQLWGGGGSGAFLASSPSSGGGGGGYNESWRSLSELGSTETITVGAGGNSRNTSGNGFIGGTSSVGSLISAYGGGGGRNSSGRPGGSGGGQLTAGFIDGDVGAQPLMMSTPTKYAGTGNLINSTSGAIILTVGAYIHGGGGGGSYGTVAGATGENSVWGGAGGAGNEDGVSGLGGISINGGNGGNRGVEGSVPGGGGGSARSADLASGAGGSGRVIITVYSV